MLAKCSNNEGNQLGKQEKIKEIKSIIVFRNMQGIQFTVVGANHPLYVIMKQRRNSVNNGNYSECIKKR